MTEISPGATLSPPAAEVPRADEILVAFPGPAPQRRWTVFLRLLLVIPHAIALWVLGVAAEAVLLVCWFAALFTGRIPAGLAGFLTDYLRWYTRVYAYAWLLTDLYPPFELGDTGYPVRIAVSPGPLNRLAVFFRLLLAIPAAIVASVAMFGASLAALVIWLIVLINGAMPPSLQQALAGALRYFIRYNGYLWLLTATYPGGLFGDKPGEAELAADTGSGSASPEMYGEVPAEAPPASPEPPAAPAEPPTVAAETAEPPAAPAEPPTVAAESVTTPAEPPPPPVPPYGQPPAESVPYGQPGYPEPGYPQPGYGQPPGYPAAPAPIGPEGWRLVLSRNAKRLMVLFLGLGVIAWIGYAVGIGVIVSNAASSGNAALQVQDAHAKLTDAVNSFQRNVQTCQQNITCVTNQDRAVASAFGAFGDSVRSASMPNSAASAAQAQLLTDTSQVQADLGRLSHATSASSYEQILSSMDLQGAVGRFDSDYQRLALALPGR